MLTGGFLASPNDKISDKQPQNDQRKEAWPMRARAGKRQSEQLRREARTDTVRVHNLGSAARLIVLFQQLPVTTFISIGEAQ